MSKFIHNKIERDLYILKHGCKDISCGDCFVGLDLCIIKRVEAAKKYLDNIPIEELLEI